MLMSSFIAWSLLLLRSCTYSCVIYAVISEVLTRDPRMFHTCIRRRLMCFTSPRKQTTSILRIQFAAHMTAQDMRRLSDGITSLPRPRIPRQGVGRPLHCQHLVDPGTAGPTATPYRHNVTKLHCAC
ncbi:hypothetical protein BCR44DRAFT_207505 [Catenaria anguillulae PL171]|uniref:Uncharacterized protein n=1 Tax=Catenaria anguillulae PL171 TaxID=765915 RepID=A0A1Y2HG18_9FUNG|nr:hypothetical protein BCR44DRAFT_207505 [Catenaria anguillulae PL171]